MALIMDKSKIQKKSRLALKATGLKLSLAKSISFSVILDSATL